MVLARKKNQQTAGHGFLYPLYNTRHAGQAKQRPDTQQGDDGIGPSLSSNAAGFVRPVVEQGGAVYSVANSALSLAALPQFAPLEWHFEDTDAWATIDGVNGLDFGPAGGALHFGYRWELNTSCSGANGCTALTLFAGVDTFRVDVTPVLPVVPGGVPEPATLLLLLLLAALGAAAASRRQLPSPLNTVSTPV